MRKIRLNPQRNSRKNQNLYSPKGGVRAGEKDASGADESGRVGMAAEAEEATDTEEERSREIKR